MSDVEVPIRLRSGETTLDPRLDRLKQFDPRSRGYPVAAVLDATKPRSYTWSCPVRLDQGPDGACVGFGVSAEAAARPVKVQGVTDATAYRVYKRAQQIDPWAGEDYEGTSVLAGIKVGREHGWYAEYRWAFSMQDLILAVGYKGPAVLGLPWYRSMFYPDTSGRVTVSGGVVGGHCVLCNGINVKKELFRLHNSWGADWGIAGECYISFDDLYTLLRDDGEACIPVLRALGPA